MPWMRAIRGKTLGPNFPLDREETVLGRDAACDISLDDHEISKRHARIVRKADGFYLEDLGSTNGTRIGDRELTEPQRLADGDLIEIGDTRLVFVECDAAILGALDTSDQTSLQIVAVRPEEKLQAVLEIARGLGGTIDLDGVLVKVLDSLFRILPMAERGFILLRSQGAEGLVLKASKLRHPSPDTPVFSRTIFDYVLQDGQALLCKDVGADSRFAQSPSVKEAQIRTMICAPLRDRGGNAFGVLQIDTRDEHGRFDEDDLGLLAAVAGPVGVAIENAQLHEIALKQAEFRREAQDSRSVQLALIPRQAPQVPGYEFWHAYEPARFVGGDYFDYRPFPGCESPPGKTVGRWAVAIGDVSGKGMPAALLMARLSSEVGLLLQAELDPTQVVERLNRGLCEARHEDRFITFLLAVLDVERHELTVVNAGHMAPLVRRNDGRVEEVASVPSGLPLGIDEDSAFGAETVTIGSAEVVVLYTDGITDAGNTDAPGSGGCAFGEERLKQALSITPAGVGPCGESILDAVRRHAAGRDQFDDMTLICLGRT
jgi:serine phosphatase RsbU (regulator of sigma subunit)